MLQEMRRQLMYELPATSAARADHPHLEFNRGERRWKGVEMKKMVTSRLPNEQNGSFT